MASGSFLEFLGDFENPKDEILDNATQFTKLETSQLICFENQLTGFFMMPTLAFNGLNECFETISILT